MHAHGIARICASVEVSDEDPAKARLLTSTGDTVVDAQLLEVVRAAGTAWRSAEGQVYPRYTKSPQQMPWVFWGDPVDAKGPVLGCVKTTRQ
jgi:hypothetical protein